MDEDKTKMRSKAESTSVAVEEWEIHATAEMIDADVAEKDLSGGLSTEAEGKRCRHGVHPIPGWMIPCTSYLYIRGWESDPQSVRFGVEYYVPRGHQPNLSA